MLVALVVALGLSLDPSLGVPAFTGKQWLILCVGLLATTTVNVSTSVKRYHDRGKSGAWFLICLIPYIGAIWQFVELGFLRGEAGTNKYDGDTDSNRSWDSDFGSDTSYANFTDIDAKIAAMKSGSQQSVAQASANSPVARMNTRLPQGQQGFGRRTQL
jgi:hypothetical protein